MPGSQEAHARDWQSRADRLLARTRALPADPGLLCRRPGPDAWSAAQVLEHLVLATGSYLGVMRQRVEASGSSTAPAAVWRPTLGGRLLVRSMESPRRLPTPRGWAPKVTPRPHVQEAFAEELREYRALLERAATIPWTRMRYGSPALALLRLNLGDGFHIIVVHAERHFRQIDRALAAVRGGEPGETDP